MTDLFVSIAHVSQDNGLHVDTEVGLLLGGVLLVALAIIWLI
jgi:hypothetical protein